MIAGSQKEAVNVAHVPLFSKQVPNPVTFSGKAQAEIKQYQIVKLDLATGHVTVATEIQASAPATRTVLGVACFDAPSGSDVSVYTEGSFNVDAVNVSAITALASADSDAKAKLLNTYVLSGLYFEVVPTRAVSAV